MQVVQVGRKVGQCRAKRRPPGHRAECGKSRVLLLVVRTAANRRDARPPQGRLYGVETGVGTRQDRERGPTAAWSVLLSQPASKSSGFCDVVFEIPDHGET